jgi:hypothetical protein
MHSDSRTGPHLAACDVTAASRDVTVSPTGRRNLKTIKKSPDHGDRRLFKPARGRRTVLWHMSGPGPDGGDPTLPSS